MKREAVSVLKPHTGKSSNIKKISKVSKSSKKQAPMTGPRGSEKPKILEVQDINLVNTLARLKNKKAEETIESKSKNNVKLSENDAKKSPNQSGAKMAAVRKNQDEARVQPKKKLKTQSEITKTPAKSKKVIAKEDSTNTTDAKGPVKPKAKRRRKSKVTVKKSIENLGDLKLTKAHVKETVKAIKKLLEKKEKAKKSLLPSDNNPLLMQIVCIKVPKTPRRHIRPFLPHTSVGPLDDVALFVPDLAKGRRRDYEKTVDHWETILREKGVDCIKDIIPVNRVKTEYNQYEMQRKLAASYDYFLADGRICGHLTHLLGKAFFKRRVPPTPVKLGRDNLKAELDAALHKTCMEVHSYGNTHSMQVGTISMDDEKLLENVWAACEELNKEYPGGWNNIRSILLKAAVGPAIPIYMNLVSKNQVPVPVVKSKRPRAYDNVVGELTTVPGGARIKMTPEGGVRIKRLKDFGDEEEIEQEDEEEEEEEEEETKNESEGENVKSNDESEEEEEDDHDDDDDEAEDEQ